MLGSKKAEAQEEAAKALVSGQFVLSLQLPSSAGQPGHSLQFTGYLYYGEDEAGINARLDLMNSILERQRARYEVAELEGRLEAMNKHLEDARRTIADMEERSRKDKLSSQERLNLRNISANVPKFVEEIERGAKAIYEARVRGGLITNGAARAG